MHPVVILHHHDDDDDYLGSSGGGSRRTIPLLQMQGRVDGRSWVVDIEEEVAAAVDPAGAEKTQWGKPSIYRLPPFVRELNAKAFTPQMVSIGPYHHGAPNLLPMEPHKRRALVHFLRRSGRPLVDFLAALEAHAEQLMDSYDSLDDEEWRGDRDRFLRLMLLDGCFMLEVLRFRPATNANDGTTVRDDDEEEAGDYAPNDPFFSHHGMLRKMPYIRRDMLMLENQLPLLVLKLLLAVEGRSAASSETDDEQRYVNNLVLRFCANTKDDADGAGGLGLHVLDLFRRSTITQQLPTRAGGGETPSPLISWLDPYCPSVIVRSAVELSEAGVHFRRSGSSSLRGISFKGGVLSLPPIVMDDATECTFLNMMAFEQLHVKAGNQVTSYIAFMDEIIDSAKDVRLLHAREVIQNAMGSDKAVAELFNTIAREITLDPASELGQVRRAMNAYCRQPWNRWRATLVHNYFRSPWSMLSVAAATLVIILTVLQTFYSIKYHN